MRVAERMGLERIHHPIAAPDSARRGYVLHDDHVAPHAQRHDEVPLGQTDQRGITRQPNHQQRAAGQRQPDAKRALLTQPAAFQKNDARRVRGNHQAVTHAAELITQRDDKENRRETIYTDKHPAQNPPSLHEKNVARQNQAQDEMKKSERGGQADFFQMQRALEFEPRRKQPAIPPRPRRVVFRRHGFDVRSGRLDLRLTIYDLRHHVRCLNPNRKIFNPPLNASARC